LRFVLLESLSPVRRAVFLLREVFDTATRDARRRGSHADNCRQIALRARRGVDARRPRRTVCSQRDQLAGVCGVRARRSASTTGLLAADIKFQGDGGGKAPAVAQVISGQRMVMRLLVSLLRQGAELGGWAEPAQVNGQPGAIFHTADGKIASVVGLEIAHGQVQAIQSVVNPDKLRHLGAVADMRSLMRAARNGAGH
jgi:RNA polymerase sigma-70 factor (ECF subfamily)